MGPLDVDPNLWVDFPTWTHLVTMVLSGDRWPVPPDLTLTCVSSPMSNLPRYYRPAADVDSGLTPAAIPGLTWLGEGGMGLAVPWSREILSSDTRESATWSLCQEDPFADVKVSLPQLNLSLLYLRLS